jgi:hypothetical protein
MQPPPISEGLAYVIGQNLGRGAEVEVAIGLEIIPTLVRYCTAGALKLVLEPIFEADFQPVRKAGSWLPERKR